MDDQVVFSFLSTCTRFELVLDYFLSVCGLMIHSGFSFKSRVVFFGGGPKGNMFDAYWLLHEKG